MTNEKPSPADGADLFADAVRRHQAGDLADAERLYRQLLHKDPHHADATHLMGLIALRNRHTDAAVDWIRKAISLNATVPDYHSNLGLALQDRGLHQAAVAAYQAALCIKPDFAEAHYNRANALRELRHLGAAIAAYHAALRIAPDFAPAHANRGIAFYSARQLAAASAACRAALCLAPDLTPAYANLGMALTESGRPDDAVAATLAALRLDPNFAQAHASLGNALKDLGRFDEAIGAYEDALRLQPDYAVAHSSLLMCLHYHAAITPRTILQKALRFGGQVEQRLPAPPNAGSIDPDRRLRIGYVSGNFHRHPVGYFLSRVLESHDPASVEVFCYSNFSRSDDMTRRLQASADHWRSLVGLSDQAAADLIIGDAIDILVDLSGHTAHNRLPLFARRPAPIQATWLGFWGTTGLSRMDYILSDAVMIRPGEDDLYCERVVRLPQGRFCYDPPDYAPTPMPPPALRNRAITFGSFNNLAKLGPEVIALWSAILRALPESRLLLKWQTLEDPRMRRRVTEAFAVHAIGPQRLILRGASSHAAMLAEYGDIDIALDPFPFSGGLTSCEALWMGVPVITLPGAAASSRQTEAILRVLDLSDWIAASPADSLGLAVSLAADLPRLARLRSELRDRMARSPLCDGKGFTLALEQAYRDIWRRRCASGGVPGAAQEQLPQAVTAGFAEALGHHRAGRLGEAERQYRQILLRDPSLADALHLLGVVAHQLGRQDAAVKRISRALRINAEMSSYHSNLGNALCQLDRLTEAVAAYRTALSIQPDLVDAQYNLGIALHGLARLPDTVAAYGAVLRLKPDHAEAHSNRGAALKDLGRLTDAAAACRTATCLKPDHAKAHYNRGNALKELGRPSEAVAAYSNAIRLRPDLVAAHYNLGNTLKAMGRLTDAVIAYDAALRLDPQAADAHSNRGNALHELGHLTAAVAAYRAALGIKPDHADAFSNLGNSLRGLGRPTDAARAYRAAVTIKPDFAEAQYNLGLVLLQTGQFAEGWPKYEWRRQINRLSSHRRDFAEPPWRGQPLAGKTIFLHAEQGLGDSLQFCRYAQMLAAQGASVILEAHRALHRLLRGLTGVDRLLAVGDAAPHVDYHCPLMSLPLAFGTRVETIPATIPYLAAEPDNVELWRGRLPASGFRVGIAWQGSPTYREDRTRSIPLACFAPLARIPGLRLISLQKRHGLDQLGALPEGMAVARLESGEGSPAGFGFDEGDDAFIDSAAVMMSLDLIVSVDTAVAHLAGALGRPVWVPLATNPHWVWQMDRDDTPWYPTMRLFRQTSRGAWQDVFERMAIELCARTKDRVPR